MGVPLLQHTYGVTLNVPPGAVTDTIRFELQPLPVEPGSITPPGELLFANRAFELNAYRFGQSVVAFSNPLTLTATYAAADVAGLKPETLQLWTRSGPEQAWTSLGEPAQVLSDGLVYTIEHLSQFALFGEAQHKAYLPLVLQ